MLARESRGTQFIIVGLLLVLGGVAAVGVFLVAAGEGSIASAVILGLVAAGCLIGGISLASASARHRSGRGGLLSAQPTRAEDASTDWNTPTAPRAPRVIRRWIPPAVIYRVVFRWTV